MITYAADCAADPETAWQLISRPDSWRRWAPALRGARGLGEPEVRTGADGYALLGALPVPARVTAKQAHRSWSWQIGPLRVRHSVRPKGNGCRVSVDVEAPFPLEALVRVAYGPMLAILVQNLARVAANDARVYSSASTSAAARSPERTAPSM